MVLVPKGHAYLHYISDLAAYDPATHDGSIPGIVAAVMARLSTRKEAVPAVTPRKVLTLLPLFDAEKNALNLAWNGYPSWPDMVNTAIKVARQSG